MKKFLLLFVSAIFVFPIFAETQIKELSEEEAAALIAKSEKITRTKVSVNFFHDVEDISIEERLKRGRAGDDFSLYVAAIRLYLYEKKYDESFEILSELHSKKYEPVTCFYDYALREKETKAALASETFESIKKAADDGDAYKMYLVYYAYKNGINTKKNEILAAQYLKKAGDAKCPQAYFILGEDYFYGFEGISKNKSKAAAFFRKAMESGMDREAYGMLGEVYLYGKGLKQNFKKAMNLFWEGEKRSDCNSLYHLGELGLRGELKEVSKEQALEYLKRSALLANYWAMETLEDYYVSIGDLDSAIFWARFDLLCKDDNTSRNRLVNLSMKKGMKNLTSDFNKLNADNYEKALNSNDSKTIYDLARNWVGGGKKRAVLYKKAAELNEPRAAYRLIEMVKKGAISLSKDEYRKYFFQAYNAGIWDVVRFLNNALHYKRLDLSEAEIEELYLKSIEHNSTKAMVSYAIYSYEIVKNPERALKYLMKAASLNDELALTFIGDGYRIGVENLFEKDLNKAKYYLQLAAEMECELAVMRLAGTYVDSKDGKNAIKWYDVAVEKFRNGEAARLASLIYLHGVFGVEKNEKKAFEYMERAYLFDDDRSAYYMGKFCFDGIGIKKDVGKALKIWEQELKRDNEDCYKALALYYLATPQTAENIDRKRGEQMLLLLSCRGNVDAAKTLFDYYSEERSTKVFLLFRYLADKYPENADFVKMRNAGKEVENDASMKAALDKEYGEFKPILDALSNMKNLDLFKNLRVIDSKE